MSCGTERSLDVSRHVGLTLRAPTKDRFDLCSCARSSVQFCVSMNMKGAKHTLLSAPVKIVTAEEEEGDEADEEEKKEEEEKEEEKEDLDSSEERDRVLPSAILSRLEESVKYVNNKGEKQSVLRTVLFHF